MHRYTIENDRVISHGEIGPVLGIPYPNFGREVFEGILNGLEDFPFTRCCFSIGDWAIVSALPEIINKKHPNVKFKIPTPNWIRKVFPNVGGWTYGGMDPANNVELVFANNPYVEYFDVGEFDYVYCDHERCQKDENEPLAEQILRYFGFTDEEILKYDARPKLYFSDDEMYIGNAIIGNNLKNLYIEKSAGEYGCMLFASRLEHINNCWPKDNLSIVNLIKQIEKQGLNKDYPIFCYTTFDLEKTYWADIFNIDFGYTFIKFDSIPACNLRIQWYIKSKAKFNISYQSGFNDAVARYSKHLIATHRNGCGETTIRGVTYFQPDGAIIKY